MNHDAQHIYNLRAEILQQENEMHRVAKVEAQRDALLDVLKLCRQAGLRKYILDTGESLASVIDAAIKAVEGEKT